MDTKITGFEDMQGLKASLNSSSKLEGDLEVDPLELQVFTHSEVALVGSANHIKIRAAETGKVFLTEFPVQTAFVDAKSGSTVKLNVQEQLEVITAENAKVYYLGKPLVNAEIDDTSQIESIEK